MRCAKTAAAVAVLGMLAAACASGTADPEPTSTTGSAPTTTSTSTTTTTTPPSTTTVPFDRAKVTERVDLVTLTADPLDLPARAPVLDCATFDPGQVAAALGLDDPATGPASERGIPVVCSLSFSRGPEAPSTFVSVTAEPPPRFGPDTGNIPRLYDALADELFGTGYADLTFGEAFLVATLSTLSSQLPAADEVGCPLDVAGNSSEFFFDLSCDYSMYIRTYADGSSLSIDLGTLPANEPLAPGFAEASALADLLDGR